MKKNPLLFACLTAFLFFVVGIIELIGAIKGLNQIGSGDIFSFARGVLVFELISAIILLAASIISIAIIIMVDGDNPIYASSAAMLSLFTLSSIIDTFLSYALLKKMAGAYSDYISMPTVGVVKLVLLFIAILLFIVGFFLLKSYTTEDKACGVFAAGTGCLLVCCVLAFTTMDRNTDGFTITSTIFLLIGCLLGITEFLNSYGYSGRRLNTPNYHHSSSYNPHSYSNPTVNRGEKDSVDELRKLKELYDEGIITSEEYNEKRKKYVDKL